MSYQSYKDLEIYQMAHTLAIKIHSMTLSLPKFEMYEEGSQIRRSAKSIASNIVEGYGRRRYKNEFIKYLIYALSSCDETRELLDILFDSSSLNDEKVYYALSQEYVILGKKLNNFLKAVEKAHLTSPRES